MKKLLYFKNNKKKKLQKKNKKKNYKKINRKVANKFLIKIHASNKIQQKHFKKMEKQILIIGMGNSKQHYLIQAKLNSKLLKVSNLWE